MTIVHILRVALLATLAFPSAMAAQRPDDLYQQALRKERAEGDLEGAIKLYQQVADASDRALAARALVKIGEAYERLGKAGAESAYQRVVAQFADQQESVRTARARLDALSSPRGARARDDRHTLVFDDLPPLRPTQNPQFDFSPSGDRIVIRQEPNGSDPDGGVSLLVYSRDGTVIDTLAPPLRRMGRISPRWSPDGKHIAFIERSFLEADSTFAALKVVPADGGPARVISTDINAQNQGATGGLFWTPDSRAISIAMRDGIVTFDLTGSVTRTVPFRLPLRTQVTSYSPDGQWIAFHQQNADVQLQTETDVWILPAAGGRAVQVTHNPGFDGWPSWTADGRGIYFVSGRGGSTNVWRIAVDPASGLPKGEPERITTYADASPMYPRLIDSGRRLAFALVRETSVIHVEAGDQRRAVGRGRKPLLSPDGATIYYLAEGAEQTGLFAIPTTGGTPRRLTSSMPTGPNAFQPYVLSPDGRALAYFALSGSGVALETVTSAGGTPRQLVQLDTRDELVPAWSPAGDQLAYSNGNGLYVISASGGVPLKIAQLYKWDGWTIRWSPDGGSVAALAWTSPSEPNAVVIVPASGGEPRRLTTTAETGYKELLEWHPDGTRLSYMYYGHDDKRDGTWLAYVDGRPSASFVDQPAPHWDYVGAWKPDGSTYFFIAASGVAGWDLFAHDERTRSTRLFASRGEHSPGAGLPAFSRDGRVLAWPVTRTTRQLWSIDIPR